jgi:hypothetical protein
VLDPNNIAAVQTIIKEYLAYNFIEEVPYIPYCVLPLQLKITADKSALIYDMSKLNQYVQQAKFKLESWPEMFDYASKSQFAIKFDLKKFYHQIQINPDFKKYFGFRYTMADGSEKFFVWRTMPYGYTRSPFIAKQLMKPLISKWRRLGAYTVVFYDDGMAVSESFEFLSRLSLQMQCDLLRAGLEPGANKCVWEPVQCIDWNGLTFDFIRGGIGIKASRIQKLKETARQLMDDWPKVTYREVARCVGRINSMYPVLGEKVQIKLRMLQTIVNIRNYKDFAWDAFIAVDYVPLYFYVFSELEYWLKVIDAKNFRKFVHTVPEYICWTDASDVALGGCILRMSEYQNTTPMTIDNILLDRNLKYVSVGRHAMLYLDAYPWSQIKNFHNLGMIDSLVDNTANMYICHKNFSPEEMATSSTERELLAVYHLTAAAAELFKNKAVTLHTDSLNCQIICSKGSPKPKLHAYAKLIYDLAEAHNIRLEVVWIPRDLNVVADYVSNLIDFGDYEIIPEMFDVVCDRVGYIPEIDLFATAYNRKCNMFFSNTFEPGSAGIDAFNYDWSLYQLGWIFIQPVLIGRAVLYAEKCRANVLLLVPQWKNSYFYPLVRSFVNSTAFVSVNDFSGKKMFRAGFDQNTIFSEKFDGNVEIWHLNFSR